MRSRRCGTIWPKAHPAAKSLGIPLDEATQILIDQSKQVGIWKEAGLSVAEKQENAGDRRIDKMDEFIRTLAGIPSQRNVDINVRTN
jgi:hypothetical protein